MLLDPDDLISLQIFLIILTMIGCAGIYKGAVMLKTLLSSPKKTK